MYDLKALYEAESVAHAIRLLQEHPEAQIIAGGSDVLVQMREGRRAGKELVSIYKIDEMRGISYEEDGAIRIGSLTSFSHITKDPIIQKHINVLGEAVDMVGGPQIRNIGTIGGNTCNGVTSADSASTLHAWDAIVEITGPDGVAGPVPMRAPSAEAKAKGKPLTKAVVHEFGQAVLEDINPRDSWRASKAFRQHIATVLAERALTESIRLAGGVIDE